jgi:hypothetical protein
MLEQREIIERLTRIETHLINIKEQLKTKASKSALDNLKWVMGGIASLALAALTLNVMHK